MRIGLFGTCLTDTLSPDIELAGDDPPLSAAELDMMAGVVTGCAVAIAETGTIILEHGPGSSGQGRRARQLHVLLVSPGTETAT